MTEARDALTHHLAQYNIARLVAPLDDPRLVDFVEALDRINQLGDRRPGFVWRHQNPDGNSTCTRVRADDAIVINFSVWESVEALFEYTYHSAHVGGVSQAAAVVRGHGARRTPCCGGSRRATLPSVEEADERLGYLREHGPTAHAFTFKSRFAAPVG